MATSPSSTCGVLGLDAGWFGRWSRLAWGLLILFPFVIRTLHDLRTN